MYVLLISVHLVGKSQVDLALGLIFTLAGLVFLVSIPMFGYFNEKTDSYTTTFILYGIIELFGGLFLVTIPIYLCVKGLLLVLGLLPSGITTETVISQKRSPNQFSTKTE